MDCSGLELVYKTLCKKLLRVSHRTLLTKTKRVSEGRSAKEGQRRTVSEGRSAKDGQRRTVSEGGSAKDGQRRRVCEGRSVKNGVTQRACCKRRIPASTILVLGFFQRLGRPGRGAVGQEEVSTCTTQCCQTFRKLKATVPDPQRPQALEHTESLYVRGASVLVSWIRVCVQLLLFIVFGGRSQEFDGNPVTDDISKLSILRHNIPKDYKIPVRYIPREEGGMCWVKLNVFYLEESLKDLSHKFGNISSNRRDISIIFEMLQSSRLKMGDLNYIMGDFQCHYRDERWATARYFDFVKDFLTATQRKEFSDDCEPPPCPTTQLPTTAITTAAAQLESRGSTESMSEACPPQRNCQPQKRILSDVLERSLLSLLFIPLLAIIFLLVWKLRSRRNAEDLERNQAEDGLFTGSRRERSSCRRRRI
ncbi:hypothetical protein WMY93_023016 [Mugilogobius chulae]|uniref:Kit ligand n=1 Tax=Mugilogobius chulae TaxID=88201 RepID=A0AAW0NDL4_9GOBI